jgi:hypothetical protein
MQQISLEIACPPEVYLLFEFFLLASRKTRFGAESGEHPLGVPFRGGGYIE